MGMALMEMTNPIDLQPQSPYEGGLPQNYIQNIARQDKCQDSMPSTLH